VGVGDGHDPPDRALAESDRCRALDQPWRHGES
jgi:hypothetical protein